MRLDPKLVRYVTPFVRLTGRSPRFVGRENNVQLTETALVFEGDILKLSLLGFEILFRRALSEWSAVTVPYSRIDKARYSNWSVARIIAAVVLVLYVLLSVALFLTEPYHQAVTLLIIYAVPTVIAGYVLIRARGRYTVRYRGKDGRRRAILFRIKSKAVAREFDRRLQQYRAAATGTGRRR